MDTEKKPLTPDEQETNELLGKDFNDDGFGEEEATSTIFAKTSNQGAKKKTIAPKKKRLITVISMLLSIVIIIASTYCIAKFAGNNDEQTEDADSLKIKTAAHENVAKIDIKNTNGSFTILPETVIEEGEERLKWRIENVTNPLVSKTMVGTVVDSCLTIYALREMEDKTLDYGFDNPFATVNVKSKDGKEDFAITLGSVTPDKTGYYLKADGDDKIYLVTAGTAGTINFSLEDLADAIMVDPVKLSSDTEKADKKYFDEEGAISTFDHIKLSGTKYNGEELTITPIQDNAAASYSIKTAEGTRFANATNCEKVFGMVKNGLVAVEIYKLSPTDEDIKAYGLNNPEYTVKIKYGTNMLDFKATMYDEEKNHYAVMINGKDAIYAMSGDALDMLGIAKRAFYNDYIFLEYYNVYSKVAITTENGEYVFDTEYNENADTDNFTVYANGNKVDADLFTSYYQHIVNIAPKADDKYIKGEPSYKAVFTFADTEKGVKTITLTKQSDRRYLVSVDGIDMGIVTSRTYDNLTEYVDYIINGKEIPEP